MKRKHISFFTNIDRTQIIDNGEYIDLRGIPVTVDNAVMNGLLYSAEENEKGMPSLRGKVVTNRHPQDANGQAIDAYNEIGLMEFFSGGTVTNVFKEGNVRKADIRIKKEILKAQDKSNGTDFYNRIESRQPIGVSTGLFTSVVEQDGQSNGEDYYGVATEQEYNHLAMLTSDEPPAGGEATFMRFNSEECESVVINIADFIEEETILRKLAKVLGLVNDKNDDYNDGRKDEFTNETEGLKMSHQTVLAKALGINAEDVDKLSDSELEAKFNELQTNEDDKNDDSGISQVLNAVETLTQKVSDIESKVDSVGKKDKDALVNALVAVENKHGLSKGLLENMQQDALEKMHSKFCKTGTFLNSSFAPSGETKIDSTMPGGEA